MAQQIPREEQRQRRKRVGRIKSGIVIVIVMWMLLSFISIVLLLVQVIRLNNRVRYVEQQSYALTQAIAMNNGLNADSTEPSGSEMDAQDPDKADFQVSTGIDESDNMAEEGDLHQVYLTFDCEPGANTNAILDELAKYEVKATFFVSGDDSEEAKAVYQRIVEEGHTLGMHSYANQYSAIYGSVEAFQTDYARLSDYLYEVTGVRSRYYRFPGGSGNGISNVDMVEFAGILTRENITYFDWNVSAGDATNDYSVEDIVSNVTEGVSHYKTSVVLLHDGESKSTTAEAIGPLVEALRQMQAEVLPIDENTHIIQYLKIERME